jgi:signal transduction histidine kinase
MSHTPAFILIIALMALVIILLTWLNWKRSKKNRYIIRAYNKHLDFALESLEQRSRDYEQVLKVVAHDLRNPVGGISGLTLLLAEEAGLSEDGKHMLGMIRHSCGKIMNFIEELLESKYPSESRQLTLALCDMRVLLKECVSLLRFRAGEKQQRIRLGKVPPSLVLMDQDKMWKVFNNLIANAIKFSPEKSVIRVFAEKQEEAWVFCVADSGIDNLPELSVCRQIVEAHGGKIWFVSEAGRGTTFCVSLPVLEVAEEAPAHHVRFLF